MNLASIIVLLVVVVCAVLALVAVCRHRGRKNCQNCPLRGFCR